ncbi:type VI secretion system lipoprotein TssJ [Pyxidicoccus sp. MSG2]|uniref:type VI secretion system lipoprotein TssJ n=1 Tax=Pyxidicoccus sp. MSG2 TaxID=2996790 RepID=UPI00226E600E|nr:type VI secretion system lipoprotein TssJ [Pyxidicoccus sp. MSG2]MCY1021798.1 type VI secretion system lipoprotein TssJ [Pyxidicoccus sp. MSG2]
MVTALALVLGGSAGCAKRIPQACETPPPFQVVVDAAEQLNPDARGRSLPTVVQIVQLKDSVRLERAGFKDLWGKPEELLKEDLLQVAEVVVPPGRKVTRWVQRDPKARFVLAMGHFRQPLGYSWRTVAVLPVVKESQCVERPAGDQGEPKPEDEVFRYRLQGYQIDLLFRPITQAPTRAPESQPQAGDSASPRRGV